MVKYKHFNIANFKIGKGNPTFIIAEIGQNHDGSLGTAHAFIDAVSKTGANAMLRELKNDSKSRRSDLTWLKLLIPPAVPYSWILAPCTSR